MTSSNPGEFSRQAAPPAWRTMLSFLIFVHLFLVAVALSSNYMRSGIAQKLLQKFGFYTRFLNIDLNFARFHLTHGTDFDVEHRIEMLPKDGTEWLQIPSSSRRGTDSFHRYQRYASNWAFQAANDGQPALFAQAVGTFSAQRLQVPPRQVRCRKHFQQAREDLSSDTLTRRDPIDPSRFSVAYAANAIVNQNGSVDVVRVEETGQVAAPVTPVNSAGGTRGTNIHVRDR